MTGFLVVGLAGGLFSVVALLLAEVAVGLLAFRDAAVGLLRVDGLVVGVAPGFDVDNGLLVVLDAFERSAPRFWSSPKAFFDLEVGRSMVCWIRLLYMSIFCVQCCATFNIDMAPLEGPNPRDCTIQGRDTSR